MRARAALIMAAAAIGSAPATAQPADPFCAELRRIVRAAADDPPFDRLERGRAAPPRLGFRDGCRVAASGERRIWTCHQNLAPESLALERLAARTGACLAEAERRPAGRRGEARFVLPGAAIRITERGGPRAHVGRIVTLRVEPAAK